jgi:hypothetical protein
MANPSLAKLLSQQALPLDTVKIGRLVNRPKEPWQDFCNYTLIVPGPDDISDATFEGIKDTDSVQKSVDITSKLTEILSIIFSRQKTATNKLNTEHAIVRRLLNSPDFFDKLCGIKYHRDWMAKSNREERDVFPLVGLIIVTDAAINRDSKTVLQGGASLQSPVTAILSSGADIAATPVLPKLAGAANPQVTANVTGKATTTISFDVPGERIIGV